MYFYRMKLLKISNQILLSNLYILYRINVQNIESNDIIEEKFLSHEIVENIESK